MKLKTLNDLGIGIGVQHQIDIKGTAFKLNFVSFFYVAGIEPGPSQTRKTEESPHFIPEALHDFFNILEGIALLLFIQQPNGQGEFYFSDVHLGY